MVADGVFYTLIASVSLVCVLALSRQYARSRRSNWPETLICLEYLQC
jgi:hypothetical protein